ncbi:uncharacterized protein LOC131928159 [Physella acuta]|uniref:uncharacterized protein LOC131928159 n=1 Tax=Physella acuta TaxID=109671 RepID=UPI0027DE28DB|nr:uncharacterized protein LOC131928159 [Physella acuta]
MEKFRCFSLPAFLPMKVKSYYLEKLRLPRSFFYIFIKQKPVSKQLANHKLIFDLAERKNKNDQDSNQQCVTEISEPAGQRVIKDAHHKTYTTVVQINQHLNLGLGLLTTVYLGLLKMASDAFIAFTSTTAETLKNKKVNDWDLACNTNNNEDFTKKYLIVGLGNHGYPNTRHSIGMRAVDRFAENFGVTLSYNKQYGGFANSTTVDDTKLVLFKPKALMNINGISVAKTAKLLSICPSNIYLIHDELDKVPGKFHIKEGGSAGGHNGVLSCISSLQSQAMRRLRIGIGRPSSRNFVVPYVLGKFSKEEADLVASAVDQALEALLHHIKQRSAGSTNHSSTSIRHKPLHQSKPVLHDKHKPLHQSKPVLHDKHPSQETEEPECCNTSINNCQQTEETRMEAPNKVNSCNTSDCNREPTPER